MYKALVQARLLEQYSQLQNNTKKEKDKEKSRKRAILSPTNNVNFTWPRVFNHGTTITSFLNNNSIYTTPKRETPLRPRKRSRKQLKVKWDGELPEKTNTKAQFDYSNNTTLENAKDQILEHVLDSVIDKTKPIDADDSQSVDSLATRHLTVEMLEQLFQNISNTYTEDITGKYDWEYMLGKAIETGLPAPVIERVHQRMTKLTKKESQAIAALNILQPDQLTDITEPPAETELKRIVADISGQKDYVSFECDEVTERDKELEILERYIALTQDKASLERSVQAIHDQYNQEVFKTESRYDFVE